MVKRYDESAPHFKHQFNSGYPLQKLNKEKKPRMTHKMILASPDLKTIYKVVVARRKTKDCQPSLDGRASASYTECSGSTPLAGSRSNECENA